MKYINKTNDIIVIEAKNLKKHLRLRKKEQNTYIYDYVKITKIITIK